MHLPRTTATWVLQLLHHLQILSYPAIPQFLYLPQILRSPPILSYTSTPDLRQSMSGCTPTSRARLLMTAEEVLTGTGTAGASGTTRSVPLPSPRYCTGWYLWRTTGDCSSTKGSQHTLQGWEAFRVSGNR